MSCFSLPRHLVPIAASLAVLLLAARLSAGPSQPNILFILADDLGWQDTSVSFASFRTEQNVTFRTPALARLAREGMKFTRGYSCAVCSPSRVTFLTGQNTVRHRVTQWTSRAGGPASDLPHPTLASADWNWNGLQPTPQANAAHAPSLPEFLRQAGYRTMIFGKGHLGAAGTAGADPRIFGFDVRVGGRDAGGPGSYSGQRNFGALQTAPGAGRAWDLDAYFGEDIHLTEALTREAAKAIRQAAKDQVPFFCYFAHYAPHLPVEADERFAPHYRALGLDERSAGYASLIEGMDKSVGDLIDLLDELGIAENTLVIFTSDNGGLASERRGGVPNTQNRPLSSGKGSHHEGGIRVPLLARWPDRVPAGATCDLPVHLHDWMPTFLDITHAEVSPDVRQKLDGLSVAPALRGKRQPELNTRPLFWHFPHAWGPPGQPGRTVGPGLGPCSAVLQAGWKLIYFHEDHRFELYQVEQDPGETANLAHDQPERVQALARILATALRAAQAPMPIVKATGKPVPYPDDLP